MTPAVVLIHAASVWAMVGLIWFVQVVHYPLFAAVAALAPDQPEAFAAYEKQHATLTTLVVFPLMVTELFTTILLVFAIKPAGVSPWLLWAAFASVFVNWMSTAFVQVPQHNILAAGFDPDAHAALVNTNWLRTVVWTAHGFIAAAVVWQWSRTATGAPTLTS